MTEETGVETPPADLILWAVTRGKHGNVGVLFLAPPKTAAELEGSFETLHSAEARAGREVELDRIVLVSSLSELTGLDGELVDYLEPALRRFEFGALATGR